jgi:hypothetical protein
MGGNGEFGLTASDMTNHNFGLGGALRPNGNRPWRRIPAGVETHLQRHSIRVERKHVTFELSENPRGCYLRIIEEVSGCRNAIIIPLTGIEEFRDTLNKIIQFSKTLPPRI